MFLSSPTSAPPWQSCSGTQSSRDPSFCSRFRCLAFSSIPYLLLGYVIDLPIIAVPVLVEGLKRREFGRALLSLPAYPVLRMVNMAIYVSRRSGWN